MTLSQKPNVSTKAHSYQSESSESKCLTTNGVREKESKIRITDSRKDLLGGRACK